MKDSYRMTLMGKLGMVTSMYIDSYMRARTHTYIHACIDTYVHTYIDSGMQACVHAYITQIRT